ncbi:ABC transporter permease [Actinoalloteichus hymeniacidonis]|uniref:Permease component of ribose/xylose/arabinose/galactoside ABC-type transporters n=1 Tax=Actinoalloteichus hymeniacidonis TaxID=340345 RepID=A0AAC9MWH2_9PSEU|nr:ABC transporter permease [Actinoalloteichus hymeniacidonis]AOS61051.1 permease component of ribose/xylose/arabinose/galactoside ABC-type transporters [Actinoalloteichus hymeniacidonis]MBB5910949.1 ribose/xylose/arabinose/galactoside ABC-type transport system permease subunit [Actinoalloteichus hymeniacidonis]
MVETKSVTPPDPPTEAEKEAAARTAPFWQRALRARESGLVLVLLALLALLAIRTDSFVTLDNLVVVARQAALVVIIAVGVTFVIATGGIDLSVGSVVALTSVATGYWVIVADLPYIVAIPFALLTGLACGVLNGVLIVLTRVPPFIITLGMLGIARGLALGLTSGSTQTGFAPPFLALGQGSWLGIPIPVWIAAVVAVGAHLVLSRTTLGRHVYFTGSNEPAAVLSGIRVDRVKLFVYATAGSLAALSSLLETARLSVAQPSAGVGYELTAIGAVVIGGASLFGGRGTILGTVLGAVLLSVITNGLIALQVSAYWQQAIQGAVIILAVMLNEYRSRRSVVRTG